MQVYLVGGAVRDQLLGRPVGDRDWVVVGGTPEEMEQQGYISVGRHFPVYLHPDSKEEYALARTERKQGRGHRGFVVHAAPDVTLEQDLSRRDLTINAIAQDADGQLIDPFHGSDDIQAKCLRHVSEAFAEDPLRVFRVARLAAQLPDFSVAPATQTLMTDMTNAGELKDLSAERVWQECLKGLAAPAPARFFEVLSACGGLKDWFAEVEVQKLQFATHDALLRFAELPLNEQDFVSLSQRLKVPKSFQEVALHWQRWGDVIANWRSVPAAALTDGFAALGVHHNNRHLELMAGLAESKRQTNTQGLLQLADAWRDVKIDDPSLRGRAYGAALRDARIQLLSQSRVVENN